MTQKVRHYKFVPGPKFTPPLAYRITDALCILTHLNGANLKTASSNFFRYIVASALIIASIATPLAAESAVLTISGLTHEQTGYRPNCASNFGGTTMGTGVSSYLGVVSLEANDCITPAATSFSFAGEMIFTVSSGDELFADYSGSFIPTVYPSIFLLANSIFKITGGTGYFSGTTGGGTLQGIENIGNGWGLMQLTGQIIPRRKGKNNSGTSLLYQSVSDGPDDSAMIYTSDDVAAISGLDNSLFPGFTPLGDYFYQDQNGQLLAVNTLPESGSLSLLGIGLIYFIAMRHRKISNS